MCHVRTSDMFVVIRGSEDDTFGLGIPLVLQVRLPRLVMDDLHGPCYRGIESYLVITLDGKKEFYSISNGYRNVDNTINVINPIAQKYSLRAFS